MFYYGAAMTRPQDPGEIGRTIQRARHARSLTQRQLADAAGLAQTQISLYEGGHRIPRRDTLASIVAALGLTRAQFERLRSAPPIVAATPSSTVPPQAVGALGAEIVRAVLLTWDDVLLEPVATEAPVVPSAAERATAPALWARLARRHPATRRLLVDGTDEYRSWALLEHLCEESARAAADDPAEAAELAELALYIAERALGGEPWRLCLQGYAWAFVGNARRVRSDLRGAEQAFARARALWKAGAAANPDLLDASRVLDLEASLRRDQRRFPEALRLLEQALAVCSSPTRAAHILLKKVATCEQMGDCEGAIAALERAAPLVEETGAPRQLFALRFNLAVALGHLDKYTEAAPLAAGARELAVALGYDLDLLRLEWLEARLAAGLGRRAEAISTLRRLREDFAARQVPYAAALATLDLAVLLLEEGRTAEVRAVAPEAGPIFESLDVHREALAASRLFWQAVEQDTATAELGRRLLELLERARREPPGGVGDDRRSSS
jgi:transcriptional regulator with XRE-family HTH domain/tetratricopeptide (TPR) repeat protein